MSSANRTAVVEPNEPVPGASECSAEPPGSNAVAKALPRKRPRLGLSSWRTPDAPGWRSTFLSY
jgi:hypothetical protein